jgi:predicted Zn-dependent protease
LTAAAHVNVRFDGATLARLDALGAQLSQPWRRATRSDAVRAAVLAGLAALDAQKPRKGARR